uniref:VWD domain-containing protein n=1 Tax=Herbidospora sakaeratensis TaxID=564415 RepID=UPI0012F99AF7|nr:VWD domain-containing protein [Herbidospora sakaeratensis]
MNDNNWNVPATQGDRRCVNGTVANTRARIEKGTGCLLGRLNGPVQLYSKNQCGQNGPETNSGIEYIGQARAISHLHEKITGSAPTDGIHPDIQWETTFGQSRPDIIYYDHTLTSPSAQPFVQVIEAKVATNYNAADWNKQVKKQITEMTSRGMSNVGLGNVLRDYVDYFWVSFGCGRGEVGFRTQTYVVTSPSDGLLLITQAGEIKACVKKPPPGGPTPPPLPDPLPVPTPVPVPVPAPQPWPVPVPNPIPQPVEEPGVITIVTATIVAMAYIQWTMWWGMLTDFGEWLRGLRFSKVYGEPHLITLDRMAYDMQSVGEFVLAESASHDLRVHARFVERRDNVSIIDRVAMAVDGHVVEIGNNLVVDGEPVTLASGKAIRFGETTGVLREGNSYYVFWAGMDGGVFRWDGDCCHAGLAFGAEPPADLVGLLGNADGNPGNDLRLRDGTQLPATTSATVIHGQYADSWRISNEESLFTYGPGQSTATFTDLAFPSEIVTIHDLTPEQISAAGAYCQGQDVPPGPVFDGCVLDIALTADASFAAMAAEQVTTVVDPLTATLDAQGGLAVDFQSATMPKNLRPARVSQDPATTTFAGPFSGTDAYRFYVQRLPSHLGGTLAFDLLTVGDWASDADVETVTVRTDRKSPVTFRPSELTPVATGTLASGQPYARYRVSLPFEHQDDQIEFTADATGVAGISNQAFGVDDVRLTVPIVPPQTFPVTVPFDVSDGEPAAGAGNLETVVSVDQYTFTLAQPGALYLEVTDCPDLRWTLLNAAGTSVSSGYCTDKEIRNLPAGAYRLNVQSRGDDSGAYALAVTEIPADVSAPVTVDGPPVELALTGAGQNGSWTFTGAAGQRVFLSFTEGTFGGGTNADVVLRKPDGTNLKGTTYCGGGCFADTITLPVAGTYTIALNSRGTAVGELTARITTVPADLTQAVPTDGTATPLANLAAGQNALWTFTGTTGQRMSFRFTAGTFDSGLDAFVTVRKPDGSNLASRTYCGHDCFIDVTPLPASGTYTILFDPAADLTGSLSAGVLEIPADASAAVTVGGPAVPLTTTVPGQNGAWTFAGLAGQNVSFGFTGGTFGSILNATVSVRKPDGTTLVNSEYCGTSCSLTPAILPADGAYTIVLNPSGNRVGTLTAKLDVGDVTKNVAVGGPATQITLSSPGQNGRWRFDGAEGQQVSFGFSGGTFGSVLNARVSVKKPDGTTLVSQEYCGTSCSLTPATLPTDGVYTVLLVPQGASTGSLTGTFDVGYVVSDVTVGGPAATITIASPGQNGVWRFTGQEGQQVSFGFSGGTFGSVLNARVSVKKPDGTTLVSQEYCGTSCSLTPATLPADGVYTVNLVPQAASTGVLTGKFDVGYVVSDVTVGGPASTITIASPGQNGVWRFTGTEGQKVSFGFTGGTFGSVLNARVSVKKPDGTTLISQEYCGTSCSLTPATLPADGVYTVNLVPQSAATGSLTGKFDVGHVTANVTVGGPASTISLASPGQDGVWTFTGTADQRVFFAFTGGTFGSTGAKVLVRRPDGTILKDDQYCGTSCLWDTTVLPATGAYTILLDGQSAATGSMTVRVTEVPADATAALTVNGPAASVTTTAPGQNATLTFAGTQAQVVTIRLTGNTFGQTAFTVRKPDGTTLASSTTSSATPTFTNLTLPATGTYVVHADPRNAAIGSVSGTVTG